jgi:hypothetical protein
MGAIVYHLPYDKLQELRVEGKTEYDGFKYKTFGNKMLSISKHKNAVTFYDMANFFKTSLNKASQTFLGESKLDIDTYDFTPEYIADNYDKIVDYCIQDAKLVQRLSEALIKEFENFGVYPRKLYSTAYVSYQYFRNNCNYPTVWRFWKWYPQLLQYALMSYNGGKFEVTEKGVDYYYEYDINSAYPAIIANLLDITNAHILHSKNYINHAHYGFIRCEFSVPPDTFNPVAHKRKMLNIYPCGTIQKVITKSEYDYFKSIGVKLKILDGWWIVCKEEKYPFRDEIIKLTNIKTQYKREGKKLQYHIIKIFLNSLYGKFVQLTKKGNKYEATTCWNPIYGSIITSEVRLQVTKMQQEYSDIVAVHTDSVISTTPLPIECSSKLGDFDFELEGKGVILGSGIYQIGDKTKFRGFNTKTNLFELIDTDKNKYKTKVKRPLTWREVIFHGWTKEDINFFKTINREIAVDFDTKRIWLEDWETFKDVSKRKVLSVPYPVDVSLGLL